MTRSRTAGRMGGARSLAMLVALVWTVAVSVIPTAYAASMLAVDYGTDSFKVSLVKPGVPFDVLLTKEGKRKVPALVAYRGEERFVGNEAQSLVSFNAACTFKMVCSSSSQATLADAFPAGDPLPARHDLLGQAARRPLSEPPSIAAAFVSLLEPTHDDGTILSRGPDEQGNGSGRGSPRLPAHLCEGTRRGTGQGERARCRRHGPWLLGRDGAKSRAGRGRDRRLAPRRSDQRRCCG